MKKLNNKGFAISTILFSILILGTLVFGTLYSTIANTCNGGCCEPPCSFPEPEEINTCNAFKDFDCPGEFKIGDESFCVLKTYSGDDVKDGVGDDVVVAIAKYFVNTRGSNYGYQSKSAICDGMYATYITSDYSSEFQNDNMRGYYSIIDPNDEKSQTMIKDKQFKPYPTFIDSESCTVDSEDKKYKLEYINKNNRLGTDANLIPNLVSTYYEKLKDEMKKNEMENNTLVVRLLNLRDMSMDDSVLDNRYNNITDNNIQGLINSTDDGTKAWYHVSTILDKDDQFPCYSARVRSTANNYTNNKHCFASYIKDDIYGDNGSFGGYICPSYSSPQHIRNFGINSSPLDENWIDHWLNKNFWIYSPTAYYSYNTSFVFQYFTDIVSLDAHHNLYILSITNGPSISRESPVFQGDDFYHRNSTTGYYFRPVIEIKSSFYYNLNPKTNFTSMNVEYK